MESETPKEPRSDKRARLTITIIQIVMAVAIITPIVLYLLSRKGPPQGP